jgi:hypothetical protein
MSNSARRMFLPVWLFNGEAGVAVGRACHTGVAGARGAGSSVCGAFPGASAPAGLPHLAQNCAWISLGAPHWVQKRVLGASADRASTGAPHVVQKRGRPSSEDPHFAQTVAIGRPHRTRRNCNRRYRASRVSATEPETKRYRERLSAISGAPLRCRSSLSFSGPLRFRRSR